MVEVSNDGFYEELNHHNYTFCAFPDPNYCNIGTDAGAGEKRGPREMSMSNYSAWLATKIDPRGLESNGKIAKRYPKDLVDRCSRKTNAERT